MQASHATTLSLLLVLAASTAQAQADRPDPDSIASSLTEILSLATLGTVTTQPLAAQVTRSGADYLVRLPLHGFAAPADAAVNAVARPRDDGVWDVASLTFPSSGTVESTLPNAGMNRVAYSIGEQNIHVQIDPNFVQPSSFTANLGAVRLRSDQGEHHTEQVVDRYIVDGTLSSETVGQLNFASRGKATNWHIIAHGPNGFDTDGLVRTLSGHVSVEGLDRAQGTRLLAAARAIMANARTPAPPPHSTSTSPPSPLPAQSPGISPAQRQQLQDLVDAISGLLTRFEAEQTMDDIRFSVGAAGSGTIGRVRVNMAGDTANERLNTKLDLAMDEFAVASLSADAAAYIPHHVTLKSVLAGVHTEPLMALMRAAAAPDADPAALQAQAMALLGEAGVRVGVETLAFDSGPLRVTASAKIVARPAGQAGAEIHVSATGVDALMAQVQSKPGIQSALPVILMAKGLGRSDGGAVVWDVALGDGPITVNGVPFGQPAAHKR